MHENLSIASNSIAARPDSSSPTRQARSISKARCAARDKGFKTATIFVHARITAEFAKMIDALGLPKTPWQATAEGSIGRVASQRSLLVSANKAIASKIEREAAKNKAATAESEQPQLALFSQTIGQGNTDGKK